MPELFQHTTRRRLFDRLTLRRAAANQLLVVLYLIESFR